jgi:serine/threonine-protein kinase
VGTQAHRSGSDVVGQLLAGRYRISGLVGEGRAGEVYVAEDVKLQKRVAVKLLHADLAADAQAVARFRREAEAASHLEHPNVVAATDFGRTDDGVFFLVMDHVEGTSLRAALAAAPFTTARALRIARQIALALGRAHRAGIVHRDIKPENVMLVRHDDDAELVKVLDFGMARFDPDGEHATPEQKLTRAGALLGTPRYMAPEQAVGESATAASDLYALGVILFEMLAGLHPFDGDAAAMLSAHVVGKVPAIAARAPSVSVPAPVEAIVRRLLEKEQKARYASAEAVVEAIDEAARARARTSQPHGSGDATGVARGVIARATAVMRGRHRVTVMAVVLGVAGFAIVAVVLAVRRPEHAASSARPVASGGAPVASAASSGGAATKERIRRAAVLGIPALEELSGELPGDVAVLRELAFAYDGAGRSSDALRTVERAASAATAARGAMPRDLVRIVVRAASRFDTVDEAFRLLEGPLLQDGVEALLELSSDTSAPEDTRARATKSLAKPDVRRNASEQTGFLLDLRAATSCEAKRQLLGRGGEHADGRALPALRALRSTHGCGKHGTDDCHRCLRGDPGLDRALRAAEAR